MTAISVRQLARYIGFSGEISILHDLLGYNRFPKKVYGYRSGVQLSLRKQIRRLQRNHIHLNIIRVGTTSEDGCFQDKEEEKLAEGLYWMHYFYDKVKIGIGRITRYYISASEANGRQYICDHAEAEALAREWAVDNDALDVFIVLTYFGDTSGYSMTSGSCDKNAPEMTGAVVELSVATGRALGLFLAHEVGHYLGLNYKDIENEIGLNPFPDDPGHDADRNNVMFPSSSEYLTPSYKKLREDQAKVMRSHCSMKTPWQG